MEKNTELIYWFKLCKVKKLGPKKILRLLELFHTIENIVLSPLESLLRSRIFTDEMVLEWERIKNESNDEYEKILRDCKNANIEILPLYYTSYPIELKLISSPPLTLYLYGDASLLRTKKVAIVGSRNSDQNAKKWASELSINLCQENITIVSGGAIGIDIEAHKGALSANGKTIAILASGLLYLTPEENKTYLENVGKEGLLISENFPNFSGNAIALLRRNRIISGISDAIVVVTSSGKGGTMTQLDHAFEQRIPVFCPKRELNLQPHEGLDMRKDTYKIIEIDNIVRVLEIINRKRPSFMDEQKRLNQM